MSEFRSIVCDNGLLLKIPANMPEEQVRAIKRNGSASTDAITEAELLSLDVMQRKDLVALVRRIGGARWAEIIMMTRQEQAVAMRDRLAHIALTGEIKEALVAIDRFLDREEGRPMQSIAIKQETAITVDVVDRRARAAAEADAMLLAMAKRTAIEHEV